MSLTEVKSTEAKWHNARAMALKERFDAIIPRIEEVFYTEDEEEFNAIVNEMRSMSIEIEYVCRM